MRVGKQFLTCAHKIGIGTKHSFCRDGPHPGIVHLFKKRKTKKKYGHTCVERKKERQRQRQRDKDRGLHKMMCLPCKNTIFYKCVYRIALGCYLLRLSGCCDRLLGQPKQIISVSNKAKDFNSSDRRTRENI